MDLGLTFREIAGVKEAAASLSPTGTLPGAHGATSSPVDGTSFLSLLKNPSATIQRDTLYWHYPHYYPTATPSSAIRKGDWKLIEFLEDGHVELYNLRDDLGETNNLASKMRDKAAELHHALAAWRLSVKAQMPTRNPDYREK